MWGKGLVRPDVHNSLKSQKTTADQEGIFYIQRGRSHWVPDCSRFSSNEHQVKESDQKIKTKTQINVLLDAVAREHWRYLQSKLFSNTTVKGSELEGLNLLM